MYFFFFSSRRRHTRFDCDWSSDVCSSDLLRDPVVVIGDFDRPHIHLSVQRARTVSGKRQELVRAAAGFGGPGIVYAATHASAQAARDALAEAGERVTL